MQSGCKAVDGYMICWKLDDFNATGIVVWVVCREIDKSLEVMQW